MMITSAEREQRHRHRRELAPEGTARLGVICGLLIGLAGLGAAGYIASLGAATTGAALGAADLLGLVGVFIYGSRDSRFFREEAELRTRPSRANFRKPKATEVPVLQPSEGGGRQLSA